MNMSKDGNVVLVWLAAIFALPSAWAIQLDTSYGDAGFVQTNISSYNDFNQKTGAVLVQVDGKIVMAGVSDNGNGNDFALIRYNPDGTLDTGFGGDGKLTIDISTNDTFTDLIQQADEKIVVLGNIWSGTSNDIVLLRFNVDGSLDTTFGTDGVVITDGGRDWGDAVIQQADGELVVSGQNDSRFLLVRYATNGALDTDFGTDGFAILDTGTVLRATAVVERADGILVASGSSLIAGFLATGDLDTSFGTNGYSDMPVDVQGRTMAQIDGKFVVVGANTATDDIALTRFNADGSLDTGFGTMGIVTTDVGGSSDVAIDVAADNANGKIIVTGLGTGDAGNQIVVLRYNANGSLDSTFDTDGMAETDIGIGGDFGLAITQQADNKYLVAAQAQDSGTQDFATIRYNTNGSLDTGFDTDGILIDWIDTPTKDVGWALLMQSDGKLIAGGSAALSTLGSDLNTPTDFAMVRYLVNGSLDTGFGDGGRVVDSIMSPYSNTRGLIEQADGKIVSLVGTWDGATGGMALIRYDINGGRDTSFGFEGTGVVSLAHAAYIGFQQSDGKLVVANTDYLQRFDLSGNPDNGFGNAGLLAPSACVCGGDSVVEQASGKLVVAGINGVERYLDNGTLDVSFAVAGKLSLPANIGAPWLVQQPVNGKLIVAFLPGIDEDPFTNDPTLTIMRFSADGELDTTFGELGTTTTLINDIYGGNDIHKLVVQDDGKLVVFVRTDSYDLKLLRYNTTGLLDTGFGDNGIYLLPFEARNEGGTVIAGDLVYQSGTFTTFVSKDNDFFMARFIDFETPPVAGAVVAADVTQANIGETTYAFSIDYADANGDFESSSIGNSDVSICNGGSCAVVTGTTWSGNSSSGTATYTITPPGGSWDAADNGTYTIAIVANEVADSQPDYVAANANAGSFIVSIVDPTVPDAPVIVSGTPANKGALIAFLPPANDGGASILDYRVYCNAGTEAVGATSPLLATGLINGASYNCFAWARNILGESAASAAVFVTPTDGGDVAIPPSGDGPGEVVTFTQTATPPGGGDPVPATLSVVATEASPPEPPPEADSLVSAIDISSTSSVAGYTLVVTFTIDASSINEFTGFWKYGKEAPADTNHWYDFGTFVANGNGTGYEISEDKKSLTVYLVDGMRGDDDFAVNAAIVDPALPLIQVSPVIFRDGFD